MAACPKTYFIKNDKWFDGPKNRCFVIWRFCSPLLCIVLPKELSCFRNIIMSKCGNTIDFDGNAFYNICNVNKCFEGFIMFALR